jgi:hypothetical protein
VNPEQRRELAIAAVQQATGCPSTCAESLVDHVTAHAADVVRDLMRAEERGARAPEPSGARPSTTTCRSCGADIFWAETARGARMPIDAKGEARVVLEGEPGAQRAVVRQTYVSHFATCAHAAEHRKRKDTPPT